MRELKRSIARHLMEMAGRKQINKRIYLSAPDPAKTGRKRDDRRRSFFALHWREYLDPNSAPRKALEKELKRQAAYESRRRRKTVPAPWPVPRFSARRQAFISKSS